MVSPDLALAIALRRDPAVVVSAALVTIKVVGIMMKVRNGGSKQLDAVRYVDHEDVMGATCLGTGKAMPKFP